MIMAETGMLLRSSFGATSTALQLRQEAELPACRWPLPSRRSGLGWEAL